MEKKDITKRYSNGDLNVVWKPAKCIHAGECVKRLPQVYNPDEKPWIKAENGSTDELITQIKACPSGALSYEMLNENKKEEQQTSNAGRAELLANGPLLVHGEMELKLASGETTHCSGTTAFCRCGASTNKPFCDGSHGKVDFQG
jgi:uncharacterized Fe-S cluster protein YjdI